MSRTVEESSATFNRVVMINTISRVSPEITGKEEVVVIPLLQGDGQLRGSARKLDVLCRSAISAAIADKSFSAEAGETLFFRLNLPKAPSNLLLLGLGTRTRLSAERIANAAGSASRLLKKRPFKACHLLLGSGVVEGPMDAFLHPFLKGFLLARYEFSMKAKAESDRGPKKIVIMSDDQTIPETVRHVQIVVEEIKRVRDLVNTPANILTPAKMGEEARKLAKEYGLDCRVLGIREIEKLGMGAVLSVSRGSREEPRLILLSYNRAKKSLPRVCLVGKGVTFDSGGLSIKPWQDMDEMKGDMAGGAVVMGVVAAASRLKLPLSLVGIVPCVENLPSGSAFRPGDIITTYSGKTIEILSTDAEGRLILSDALAYAQEFQPDLIMDFATLTGAVVIALGTRIAGVIGNSQEHIDSLMNAGRTTGEPVWQLPLDDSFAEMVKGEISDYKNYSGKDGSTITAAALLAEFVGKSPWCHLDIAGTFWSKGNSPNYHAKGATGYGVDLTLRFLEQLGSSRKGRRGRTA